MTKGEFIEECAIIPEDQKIIVEKKATGIYEEYPIKKVVFVNDEIHILI